MKKPKISGIAIILMIVLSLAAILINYYFWRRTQTKSIPQRHIEIPQPESVTP